ncbi:hypothetical protein A374_00415 [Fictibacillus macauensis ZFHKF-1]|uniref:Lipoprotein n=1 Tax=Fictibacillus macauensis ZFHKF-1 TaxID=1196324 RepID=I8J6E5_9BACL|nr:hypothetical protein [Fictibacillus macauensis]EIT87391.1 hypothetical protein A374_00415 [Fictibacillus macauensis ZFHKF-1]
MKKRVITSLAIVGLVLAGCSTAEDHRSFSSKEKPPVHGKSKQNKEPSKATYEEIYHEALADLSEKKVDYKKILSLYTDNLQKLVQQRDEDNETKVDEKIYATLEAGGEGKMEQPIAKQVFDKLMQNVFYTTLQAAFQSMEENWSDAAKTQKSLQEVQSIYTILKPTVQKRDAAYKTKLEHAVQSGFRQIEKGVKTRDEQAFLLGKQQVEITLMKTFYYASGALPNGYATQAYKNAKTNPEAAKIKQAAGWGYFQSLFPYINRYASSEASFIETQFNLENDAADLNTVDVNKAFVRSFLKIGLSKYKESEQQWGEEQSPVTALEGALFIDLVSRDLTAMLGTEAYKKLATDAQQYVQAAKKNDTKAGNLLMLRIKRTLNEAMDKTKLKH